MPMKTQIKRKSNILSFALVLCLLIGCLFSAVSVKSYAAENETYSYSSVLEDLKKDESFNIENYPAKAEDNSVQLIQIAESADKELLVYAYHPSRETRKLDATSINISTDKTESLADMPQNSVNYRIYSLELLSDSGVFAKYRVKDFTVLSDALRFYNITTIRRAWDENIDEKPNGGNTVSEVAFAVGKQYTAYTYNDEILYTCLETETIEITDKYVGFMRYKDGFHLFPGYEACDSHFVAFNTDRDIERLYEADVYYVQQFNSFSMILGQTAPTETFGSPEEKYAYLNSENKQGYTGGGLFHYKYEWKEIETVEEFLAKENRTDMYEHGLFNTSVTNTITDTGYANIQNKKWILRFAGTEYKRYPANGFSEDYYKVTDVSILRLKFETDGVIYNLGVVDNKQSGRPNDPDNEQKEEVQPPTFDWVKELWDKIWRVLKIVLFALVGIAVFILVIFLFPHIITFVIWLVKTIGKLIFYLLKGLWIIISAPFRGIAALVRKIKDKGDDSQ